MMVDVVTAMVILILSVVLFNQTRNYNYLSAVFPRFVLGLLMILSVILMIRAILLFRKREPIESNFILLKDLFYVTLTIVLSLFVGLCDGLDTWFSAGQHRFWHRDFCDPGWEEFEPERILAVLPRLFGDRFHLLVLARKASACATTQRTLLTEV